MSKRLHWLTDRTSSYVSVQAYPVLAIGKQVHTWQDKGTRYLESDSAKWTFTRFVLMKDSKLDDGTCFGWQQLLIRGGLVYGPLNVQDTSTPEKIVTQAYRFLEDNLLRGVNRELGLNYSFCKPSAYKYGPSQWLWGLPSFYSLNNDRFWVSPNCLGQKRRQPFYCRLERDVVCSTSKWKDPRDN